MPDLNPERSLPRTPGMNPLSDKKLFRLNTPQGWGYAPDCLSCPFAAQLIVNLHQHQPLTKLQPSTLNPLPLNPNP